MMAASTPFFIKTADCPKPTSTFDICRACENISGKGSMRGAQLMGEKWRCYPMQDVAKAKLLANGTIDLQGQSVKLYSQNPFGMLNKNGEEIPSTKLSIDGIPISYDDNAINRALVEIGINCRSKILYEYARDPSTKKLTDWMTGRRFVYIDLPKQTLPKTTKMGPFFAKLFYKERPREPAQCRRCLGTGHWANACPNKERCWDCKEEGHHRGDPACNALDSIWQVRHGKNSDCESEAPADDEMSDASSEISAPGKTSHDEVLQLRPNEEENKEKEVREVTNPNITKEQTGDVNPNKAGEQKSTKTTDDTGADRHRKPKKLKNKPSRETPSARTLDQFIRRERSESLKRSSPHNMEAEKRSKKNKV